MKSPVCLGFYTPCVSRVVELILMEIGMLEILCMLYGMMLV